MKALILAAGMGNRLGDMTSNTPKAMINVAGERLIDRVLDFVSHPKISAVGVVGGYLRDSLFDHLKSKNVTLFENKNFKDGNILTLMTALDFMDDDTLILNVDHIYPKKLLLQIIDNVRGISAMCDFDRTLADDDMKVKLGEKDELKKISKQLIDYDGGYIGMTFCSHEMTDIYKSAIKETAKIYGSSSCVEFVLGHMAANDVNINICDTSGFKWLEIDTKEDLLLAENKILGGKWNS